MEGYWNSNRIEQVIGRAVRAHSHASLPPAERTVRAFMYIATLDKSTYTKEPVIRRADGEESTDEYFLGLAARKSRIINAFLGMLQSGAVDCEDAAKCFVRPADMPPEPDLARRSDPEASTDYGPAASTRTR